MNTLEYIKSQKENKNSKDREGKALWSVAEPIALTMLECGLPTFPEIYGYTIYIKWKNVTLNFEVYADIFSEVPKIMKRRGLDPNDPRGYYKIREMVEERDCRKVTLTISYNDCMVYIPPHIKPLYFNFVTRGNYPIAFRMSDKITKPLPSECIKSLIETVIDFQSHYKESLEYHRINAPKFYPAVYAHDKNGELIWAGQR